MASQASIFALEMLEPRVLLSAPDGVVMATAGSAPLAHDIENDAPNILANSPGAACSRETAALFVGLTPTELENSANAQAAAQAPVTIQNAVGTASLGGQVWNDSNADGKGDASENGLAGWTVFIDANDNGLMDAGEIETQSDALGHYAFTGLAPGSYTVAEAIKDGWRQTYPTNGINHPGIGSGMPIFAAAQMVQASGANLKVSSYSVPTLADWNNDGLLDLVVGEEEGAYGKVRIYLNQGTRSNPLFKDFAYAQSGGSTLTVPAAGCLGAFPRVMDWDQDGRKDLAVGLGNGTMQVFLNNNTDADPKFGAGSLVQYGQVGNKKDLDVGDRTTFDFADWNNDGKKDLVVGALDGKVRIFLNEAGSGALDFRTMTLVKDGSNDLTVPSGRSSVAVTDLDGDGRQDLVIGNTNGELYFYANSGTDADPKFNGGQQLKANGVAIVLGAGISRSRPFVGDFDGDGVVDVLVGGSDGLVRFYKGQIQPGLLAGAVLSGAASNGFQVPIYAIPHQITLAEGEQSLGLDFGNQAINASVPAKPVARGFDPVPTLAASHSGLADDVLASVSASATIPEKDQLRGDSTTIRFVFAFNAVMEAAKASPARSVLLSGRNILPAVFEDTVEWLSPNPSPMMQSPHLPKGLFFDGNEL